MSLFSLVEDCLNYVLELGGGYVAKLMVGYTCRTGSLCLPSPNRRLATDQLLFEVIKTKSRPWILEYLGDDFVSVWSMLLCRNNVLAYIGSHLPLDLKLLLFPGLASNERGCWQCGELTIIEFALPVCPPEERQYYKRRIVEVKDIIRNGTERMERGLRLMFRQLVSEFDKLEWLCRHGDGYDFVLEDFLKLCAASFIEKLLITTLSFGHENIFRRIVACDNHRYECKPAKLFKLALDGGASTATLQYLATKIYPAVQLRISFKLESLTKAALDICLSSTALKANRQRCLCTFQESSLHAWEGFTGKFWSQEQKEIAITLQSLGCRLDLKLKKALESQ